jgi:hypothetical protein
MLVFRPAVVGRSDVNGRLPSSSFSLPNVPGIFVSNGIPLGSIPHPLVSLMGTPVDEGWSRPKAKIFD